jgi:ribosomal protein S6
MAETAHPEATAEGSSQAPAAKTPVYEVAFHLVPTVGEEGVGKVVEKIRRAIGDQAEFISERFPAKMTLAYTVERSVGGKREKYSESYFGWIKFASDREIVPTLEAMLRDTPEVLRSLIIETVREDIAVRPMRAVFTSDRLEGQTLKKPVAAPEKTGEVSEEELDKSIEALVQE